MGPSWKECGIIVCGNILLVYKHKVSCKFFPALKPNQCKSVIELKKNARVPKPSTSQVVEEPIAISTASCEQFFLGKLQHYKRRLVQKPQVEEAAALHWVVEVEQNLVGQVVQLVAQPEQQPCIADNTGHRLRNLHTLRMGLGH
jgi:hypothetical protein